MKSRFKRYQIRIHKVTRGGKKGLNALLTLNKYKTGNSPVTAIHLMTV